MSTTVIMSIASAFAAVIVGLLFGSFLYKRKLARRTEETDEKSKLIVKEAEIAAENLKRDKILEAKEKILKMRSEFEDEANRKKSQIITNEQKIKQRDQTISK